ncbi:DNRLRE domain-containing protein [Micromonospora sp. NPDC049679]|uniref:DNRLRE domain-containing protein n=1 Tax=Micromonospora sp. NPDC049679 TaxID=3155920 RepID=UPI0033EF2EF4
MTATVRSCLAVATAALTAVALFGIPGEPADIVAAGPDGVTGGVEDRSDEFVSLRTARKTGKKVQVKSLTSATTEVYALPDGQLRAEISAGLQRFRRAGEWIAVDLTLHAAADGSVAPAAHPNNLKISGAAGPGQHELVSLGTGSARIAMGWTGTLPAPVLARNRATYPDALPGVDLVVEANRTGFEQFLVVKTRAAVDQVAKVTYPLTGPGAVGASRGRDGVITVTDGAGKQTVRIPAPLMWDATTTIAGSPAVRRPVGVALARRPDGVDLTLAPDMAWLRSNSTVFPVTIDPSVVNPLPTFDTYVAQGDTTTNETQKDLQFGRMTATVLTRSFLTWDTTALRGKQITDSSVSFWNFWSASCVGQEWGIWSTTEATSASNWTNKPSLIGAKPHATTSATVGGTSCADGWVSIDGKGFFQAAADANSTKGFMGLLATDETSTAAFKQFRSADGDAPSEDPKASVTYNSYPTVTTRATVPTSTCATGASRPVVNSLTPQLKATVADADATAMSVTFEWWAMNADTAIGSTTFTNVASGATASATVPAGAFVDGGIYRWRVKAADGTAGSDKWSSFCEMSVYTTVAPVTGCRGGTESDFNGDGITDIAVADPEVTVNGQIEAGQIHVTYGGTGAVQTLNESNSQVQGTVEIGDRFGTSISSYDANNDGCTDLAVGVPGEDVGTPSLADVGVVYVLLGAPAGLAKGPASLTYHQDMAVIPDSGEAGDSFGYSVAGSRTASGEPFLVIGVPAEDIGTGMDTGLVHYLRGNINVALSQGGGIPGAAEIDDRTGYAVTASTYHWAVSSAGEAIGAEAFAGFVNVFTHELVSGLPKLAAAVGENSAGVSGDAEANDNFGKSISLAPYRPVGAPTGTAESLLAVGAPGEDLDGVADAGMVQRFHIKTTGFTELLPAITQSTAGIAGDNEDGDYFGEVVLLVNTAPAAEATDQTLLLAVGVPGKDPTGTTDAGEVHVFAAAATTITADTTVSRKSGSLPGAPIGQELLGTSLAGTSAQLYVGSPYGVAAVYGFAWSDLAAGSAAVKQTWQPGVGGIPAGETAFGAAIS